MSTDKSCMHGHLTFYLCPFCLSKNVKSDKPPEQLPYIDGPYVYWCAKPGHILIENGVCSTCATDAMPPPKPEISGLTPKQMREIQDVSMDGLENLPFTEHPMKPEGVPGHDIYHGTPSLAREWFINPIVEYICEVDADGIKLTGNEIHVIEFSAYEAVVKERDELERGFEELVEQKCNHAMAENQLRDQLAAMTKERDELERVHVEVRKRDAEALSSAKEEIASRDKGWEECCAKLQAENAELREDLKKFKTFGEFLKDDGMAEELHAARSEIEKLRGDETRLMNESCAASSKASEWLRLVENERDQALAKVKRLTLALESACKIAGMTMEEALKE